MKHGFIKVAAATFESAVADCHKNANKIIDIVHDARNAEVKILVLPELAICSSTCGDLFFSERLLDSAASELCRIADKTSESDTIIIVGFPLVVNNKIYNSAAFLQKGEILGIVPKTYISANEARYFSRYEGDVENAYINGRTATFGNIMFCESNMPQLKIGVDIGAEAFVSVPPSTVYTSNGATIIVNPFSEHELVQSEEYRHIMLSSISARNI